MSELVKRIRDYPGERIAGSYELREQAAARIEALEKALRQALVELFACSVQLNARKDGSIGRAIDVCRAALAPEKVKPVMAASEKAAEVVSGWSDAKKDYASRAVPSTLAEGQDK